MFERICVDQHTSRSTVVSLENIITDKKPFAHINKKIVVNFPLKKNWKKKFVEKIRRENPHFRNKLY